ncbi:MAG: PEP-CTERM system TPR-repeat protein PrsT, partial [Burkholderiales bacterium]|nr:PEP-CTERM system TPR-repeat protein PrsT [Burkholderiales bacterium]
MRIAARLLAAGCLSVLLVLSGCKGDSSENFVASAKSFIAKGDYPAAVIQLKNALQAAPEDAEVRYLLGSSLRNSGDPAAAEIELRKALALGYDVNLTVPELFRALVEQGAGRKIRDEASGDRVTTNAAKAEVTAVKAEVHFMGREFEQARAGYGEAMKLDPANARARIGQVRMAIFDGRLDEAQTLVDQILATSPESVEALQIKGDLFSNDGKKAEAIQTWNEAIKIKPNALNVYLALIPALVRNKDLDGATAQVATLKKTAPGAPPTIYLDALVTFSKGNAKEARELARQLLKVSPDYIPGLLLAGSIEHDLQNYLQAEEHLQKVVSALPEQAYPRRLLVSTFLRSGNLAKAKESLAILSKLAPDEPSTLMLIGEVALASKDGATAARNFEKAAKRAPDNVSVQTRLAQANLLKGDVEQAIDMLEAASAADSIHSEADITLISHYLQARDFTKAQQAADALVRKQPSSAPAIATKGLVQLAHRDYDNARKSFESALQLDPTFVPAARSLAALDLRDKKVDSAKQRYRDLLARDPKQVSA